MKTITLKPFFLFIAGAIVLLAGVWLVLPQPTEAQCGSSASSCKTCHETQKQHPVNTQGDWHTQHAFGDFCEFCHAGNVQAADKDAAHQGLVHPLEDVAASCQSCHPQDTTDRAQKYAAVLGVELGAGGSAPASDAIDSGSGAATGGGTAANCAGVTAPLEGEEIDMNLLYAEKLTPPGPNWGNIILILMILGLGAVFAFAAYTWEGWGAAVARWIDQNVGVVTKAIHTANAGVKMEEVPSSAELASLFERKPELKALWPRLAESDPAALNAIARILQNEKDGPALLQAIARLNKQ